MALRLDPVPQVWGITGNLGGGKSLSAVCLAAVAMSRGFFVVSNITLNLDELAAEYGDYVRRLYQHFSFEDDDFDPFALPTGSPRGTKGGKRVLVIMDECAEWIDQYTSANSNPRIKKFLSWLRHSSKRSQDVILVVQRLDYLNKNIRLLISKWLIVDDLRVWRAPVVKMRIPFMGGFVMQRVFDRNKKLVQGPCIVNKKAFGRFYNTAECLNTEGASVNYEYVVPSSNNYPFLGFLLVYLLSLFLLLSAIFMLSARIDKATTNTPIERVIKQRRGLSANRGRAKHAVCARRAPNAVFCTVERTPHAPRGVARQHHLARGRALCAPSDESSFAPPKLGTVYFPSRALRGPLPSLYNA